MVRVAVAVSELVFLIQHFARIDVSPANRAEPDANSTHIQIDLFSFHIFEENLHDINISYCNSVCSGIGFCLPSCFLRKAMLKQKKIEWSYR